MLLWENRKRSDCLCNSVQTMILLGNAVVVFPVKKPSTTSLTLTSFAEMTVIFRGTTKFFLSEAQFAPDESMRCLQLDGSTKLWPAISHRAGRGSPVTSFSHHSARKVPVRLNLEFKGQQTICISRNSKKREDRGEHGMADGVQNKWSRCPEDEI